MHFYKPFISKYTMGPNELLADKANCRAQEEALRWELQAALCIPQLEVGRAVLWHQAELLGSSAGFAGPHAKGTATLQLPSVFIAAGREEFFIPTHSVWATTSSKSLPLHGKRLGLKHSYQEMRWNAARLPKRLGVVNKLLWINTSAPRYHC